MPPSLQQVFLALDPHNQLALSGHAQAFRKWSRLPYNSARLSEPGTGDVSLESLSPAGRELQIWYCISLDKNDGHSPRGNVVEPDMDRMTFRGRARVQPI